MTWTMPDLMYLHLELEVICGRSAGFQYSIVTIVGYVPWSRFTCFFSPDHFLHMPINYYLFI